jgi:hypothetical protein
MSDLVRTSATSVLDADVLTSLSGTDVARLGELAHGGIAFAPTVGRSGRNSSIHESRFACRQKLVRLHA